MHTHIYFHVIVSSMLQASGCKLHACDL
ncbi:hypothetical protein OIU76_012575 [Salix suchowensis]|nr:hypothetical protein OIU76_012575 [Salix suchowensis]KAJ6358011.1 hypothetical protein OIU78_005773 [Salix suchowensis]